MRWAGHVARMGDSRGAYRVLVVRPEGKRPLGRHKRRWNDNIKMDAVHPHTRPTQRLSRPPPIQKLGAENRMLQLNVWCSWWRAYVPETCQAKNISIKLPCCIKLAFQIITISLFVRRWQNIYIYIYVCVCVCVCVCVHTRWCIAWIAVTRIYLPPYHLEAMLPFVIFCYVGCALQQPLQK